MSAVRAITTANYIGRFAPSPSGPLHFGSLIAALGSYLQAKSQQGKWLLRIEDIDTPRVQSGADSAIMRTLEAFGLYWDDAVIYQSQRLERYQQIFSELQQRDLLYGCQCSRREISLAGGIYAGNCAKLGLTQEPVAWRLRATGVSTQFDDLIFGCQQIDPRLAHEDYIVKRRDGLFSYQLVVVIDDMDQQITEVIRGADLLSMTSRQQHLFSVLTHAAPRYGHLPLAVSSPGHKLSKQNHASALEQWPLQHSLCAALQLLGHPVPSPLSSAPVSEIMAWALKHWQLTKVPVTTEIHCSTFA